MAHRAVTTAAGYLMTIGYRRYIELGSVAGSAPTDARRLHAWNLRRLSRNAEVSRQAHRKMPKDAAIIGASAAVFGLPLTGMAALHHPKLFIWNRP